MVSVFKNGLAAGTRGHYGPRGLSRTKPVQMRLLPDERREFEALCLQLGSSESHTARQIYLAGLGVYRNPC